MVFAYIAQSATGYRISRGPSAMESNLFVFNGIDVETGGYLVPPMSGRDVARVALREKLDAEHLRQLRWRRDSQAHSTLGAPKAGVDANDLAQAGWGVIFGRDADEATREALRPLLEHRAAQAGRLYREFVGLDGHRPGEQSWDFLRRWRHEPAGVVDPERMPYYLMIVGEPEDIPFRFQYQLDVQFAVGRIAFDAPEDYARYARSMVRAETLGGGLPKRATFFAVRNSNDQATQASADQLVRPLSASFSHGHPDWTVDGILGAEATKARLRELLGGNARPRMLFTASHGMGFPFGHADQVARQGSLLCQDWPGPIHHRGPIPRDFYFAGEDVADDADLTGMVAFLFACFGGGTPRLDDFSHLGLAKQESLAQRAFVAALPRRLLSHPRGGALAVVAHVERAWSCSFLWPEVGPQLQTFESALQRIAAGIPIGSAMECFNDRYAQLATMLWAQIEEAKTQKEIDALGIADTWTAHNDARSYVIVGDPAVRLS